MIDKIVLLKNDITDLEKLQVIEKNNLQTFVNEKTNERTYNNQNTKNLTGGIHISIKNETLKIEGSVHKFWNWLQFKTLENYTVFTMQDFLKTIEILFNTYSLPKDGYLLKSYEVGMNVYLEDEHLTKYLKKVKSIGNLDGTQKKLYINPRYKYEGFLCTTMHKDNTIIFRIYDKNLERTDKGKKTKINPCIRIETLRLRQKNISFTEFCKPENLTVLQMKFFSEWNKLNFDKEVQALKQTSQNKKDLAKKIILKGSKHTLAELEERKNQLTPKIYRTTKEFIKNWENVKHNFSLINCEISPIWAKAYNTAMQLVTKSTITNY